MQPVISRQDLVRSQSLDAGPGTLPARRHYSGFTLVELIVGIVVTAIALTFVSSLFFAAPSRSVEPLLQIRAVEFGQALMEEIIGKKFDELTSEGGVPPCAPCSSAPLGSEGEVRANFNDVDDYNDYCNSGDEATNAFGVPLSTVAGAYTMSVCVIYDGDYDGIEDTNTNAKLITVSITPPRGSGITNPIVLSAYRSNF